MANFDLKKNIDEVTAKICRGIASSKVRREIMQEYADHIEDEFYNLTLGGKSEAEAFRAACETLGPTENYREMLEEIHNEPELLPEEVEMLRRQRLKKAVGAVATVIFVLLGAFFFRHILLATLLLALFIWLLIYVPAVIRFAYKRVSFMKRLGKICGERGFRLHCNSALWWLGGMRGKGCDFYVETDSFVCSVKLIGNIIRKTEYKFIDRESYGVKNLWWVCFFKGYHPGMLPFDVKKKKPYDMKYKMTADLMKKTLVPIILVNPWPYIMQNARGVELCGDGDITPEGVLLSGSGFIKKLSEIK